MSEREFELYLSLLSRFLRLNPNQRAEIADELRDHLAERLEELTAEGLSRDDAIHRALSEFGDAADLAAHFTHIANRRKRRLIMRCTVGTVVATAACILFVTAFWPQNRAVNLPPQLAAQDQAAAGNNKQQPAKPKLSIRKESPEAKIERALRDVTELDLVDMPFSEVIDLIREQHKINIMLDTRVLEEEGIDTSEIVNFQLSGIKLSSALKIILEQLDEPLVYIIEDETMKITTLEVADAQLSIEVYPIGDLLEGVKGKLIHPKYGSVVPVRKAGGGGFASQGGGGFGITQMYLQSPGEALIEVMTSTVQPESWETNKGFGMIEEFNGLLVARANQDVHREIENLLKMMRAAAKENNRRKKAETTFAAPRGAPDDFKFFSSGGFDPDTAGDFGTFGKKPLQEQLKRRNRNVSEAGKKE